MTSGSSEEPDPLLIRLLRTAERVYVEAIRGALADGGFDDVPPAGIRVIVGLARGGSSVRDLGRALGVTSQAASQLADTLAARGCVERTPDLLDRRRTNLTLTERGRQAAGAIGGAVRSVDEELEANTTSQELAGLRVGLQSLIRIGQERRAERTGT